MFALAACGNPSTVVVGQSATLTATPAATPTPTLANTQVRATPTGTPSGSVRATPSRPKVVLTVTSPNPNDKITAGKPVKIAVRVADADGKALSGGTLVVYSTAGFLLAQSATDAVTVPATAIPTQPSSLIVTLEYLPEGMSPPKQESALQMSLADEHQRFGAVIESWAVKSPNLAPAVLTALRRRIAQLFGSPGCGPNSTEATPGCDPSVGLCLLFASTNPNLTNLPQHFVSYARLVGSSNRVVVDWTFEGLVGIDNDVSSGGNACVEDEDTQFFQFAFAQHGVQSVEVKTLGRNVYGKSGAMKADFVMTRTTAQKIEWKHFSIYNLPAVTEVHILPDAWS